jgi:hypothetical protein
VGKRSIKPIGDLRIDYLPPTGLALRLSSCCDYPTTDYLSRIGFERSGERFEGSADAMVDLADCVIGAVQDLGDLVVRPVEALPQYEDSALQRGQVTPSTPARQTTGCLLGYDLAGPGRG